VSRGTFAVHGKPIREPQLVSQKKSMKGKGYAGIDKFDTQHTPCGKASLNSICLEKSNK
jgi:hypothetical protein